MAEREHWLAGRVAVVTGASRGIGRATADSIARAGAHAVVAARGVAAVEATVAAIRDSGGRATAAPTDVGDAGAVEHLFSIASGIGPPTALVCAAATLEREPFDEISLASWEHTIRVNLTGVFNCCRAAFALMRDAGEGHIVNIASLSGVYATEKFPGLAAYNTTKYGVAGLTEAIAVEGKPFGITAISLSPGAVDTDMLRKANPSLRASVIHCWGSRPYRRPARQPVLRRQRRQYSPLLECDAGVTGLPSTCEWVQSRYSTGVTHLALQEQAWAHGAMAGAFRPFATLMVRNTAVATFTTLRLIRRTGYSEPLSHGTAPRGVSVLTWRCLNDRRAGRS